MEQHETAKSIEMQIDNFLEQFKRSASKAMDGEWTVVAGGGGATTTIATTSTPNATTTTMTTTTSSTSSSAADVSAAIDAATNSTVTASSSTSVAEGDDDSMAQHQWPQMPPQQQQQQQLDQHNSQLQAQQQSAHQTDNGSTSGIASVSGIPRVHGVGGSHCEETEHEPLSADIGTDALLHLETDTVTQSNSAEHSHQFEHQSSIVSIASVQTVLHLQQQPHMQHTHTCSDPASNGCGDSVHESISTASFHSTGHHGQPSSPSAASASYTMAQHQQQQLQQHQQQHHHQNNNPMPAAFAVQGYSNGAIAYATQHSDETNGSSTLQIGDVADLLHPQYAIITGGRARDGSALITFPDHCNFHLLAESDYAKLILYLTSVPSLQEADLGFNLIVDRRKDRWTSVKAVLVKISDYFPGMVHIVYVIRPSGFFQKAISEVSTKLFKDEFKFRVVICTSVADLYAHLERSQLTNDLGGDLTYSHHEWIQQRISLEKFSSLTHNVSCRLDAFMRVIHDTEFPNSVEATKTLLDKQGGDYERLKEEILSAARHGERLLDDFRSKDDVGKEFAERNGNVSATERTTSSRTTTSLPSESSSSSSSLSSSSSFHDGDDGDGGAHRAPSAGNHLHVYASHPFDDSRDYRRLLVQLEETERRFDDFWNSHLTRLRQCLDLRLFEQAFRELQATFDGQLQSIGEMTEIGETVTRVDALLRQAKLFQSACSTQIDRAKEVIATGQQLISVTGACPADVVQPKCDELSRVCDLIEERLARRTESLHKCRELMERVEKANEWCTRGIALLASQRIEKCSASVEIAETSLQEIREFMTSASEFCASDSSSGDGSLRSCFDDSVTPETRALVTQVLQRIDDVSLMCEKREASLKKHATRVQRPVQQVIPEPAVPLQPPGGAPPLLRPKSSQPPMQQTHSMDGSRSRPQSMEGPLDFSPDSDTANTAPHMQSKLDLETCLLKRGHVLAELLETERVYVAEMGFILKGYRDQMYAADLAMLVPPGLHGQEDVLFGNLQDLYTFHSEVFLRDLENCISTTELVALCFVQHRKTFYDLYAYYCQNIPRSEQLRETLVDTHLFLQECQRRLGHKLPLAAYLLKPVQRITKYQLLLKDLLKFSDHSKCAPNLQSALDVMMSVIRCVNDSMHQIAITGFPADIQQQGELLMQNSFRVISEYKKDMRLRLRPQERHIFLYPKVMLFCKVAAKANQTQYQFKHYLKMSEIGITESVRGGDERRFEVWTEGRNEVHTIQAATLEVKNAWVKEINNVLFSQLKVLKKEKILQYGQHRPINHTTSWAEPKPTAAPSVMANQRAMSCDDYHAHKQQVKVTTTTAATGTTAAISSSSSEPDNYEAGTWSSDYSNSEDECSQIGGIDGGDNAMLGSKFVSLADYCALGHSEVSLREGDTIELLKIGCAGWWFVKILGQNVEGWAPAAYLESVQRKQPANPPSYHHHRSGNSSQHQTPHRRRDKSF